MHLSHRWCFYANMLLEWAITDKTEVLFSPSLIASILRSSTVKAVTAAFCLWDFWVLSSEGVLTASLEHVISSREQRWSCNFMDALSSFSFCVQCLRLNGIKSIFWPYTFVDLTSKQTWDRQRETKREKERERETIPNLKSIYFSKTIHIPFMPQMKCICNVYNTKRDSISTIFDVQIWE